MQILFLVALVPCFIYYLLKGTKTLHMLQQNWYNEGNRYIRWILENKYKVFIDPDMFFVSLSFATESLNPSEGTIIIEMNEKTFSDEEYLKLKKEHQKNYG